MAFDEKLRMERLELQELILWAISNRLPLSRIKMGSVELELLPLVPDYGGEVANSDGKGEDSTNDEPSFIDPDGPVTEDLLFYSSGGARPADDPEE